MLSTILLSIIVFLLYSRNTVIRRYSAFLIIKDDICYSFSLTPQYQPHFSNSHYQWDIYF